MNRSTSLVAIERNEVLADDHAELNAVPTSGAAPTSAGRTPENTRALRVGADGMEMLVSDGALPVKAAGAIGVGKFVLMLGALFPNDGVCPGRTGSTTVMPVVFGAPGMAWLNVALGA
jgi:hypothetical protein